MLGALVGPSVGASVGLLVFTLVASSVKFFVERSVAPSVDPLVTTFACELVVPLFLAVGVPDVSVVDSSDPDPNVIVVIESLG